MSVKVAIAGATGYAGGEIIRLLLGHPAYCSGELSIGALTGASSAGKRAGEVIPHAAPLADRTVGETAPEVLAGHDVVFLALPHGHSAAIAEQLPESTVIIDCGADFRLRDAAAWEHYYGTSHAGSWTYGIPELPGHREALAAATRIAVPGCFPTGATLALFPAVAAGLVTGDLAITSITGVSGAGKKASVDLSAAEIMGSLKPYNTAGRHRHIPEILQNLREVAEGVGAAGATPAAELSVSFTPVLAPLPRGILTVASAPLARPDLTDAEIRQSYQEYYEAETFVGLLPEGVLPQTQYVAGSNLCQVQVERDEGAGRLLATSAIDNLTKGTGGAAIQCMNLALGWDEADGLPQAAVAP